MAANVFGTMGAILWSLQVWLFLSITFMVWLLTFVQLLPQIWKNWRRHDTEGLSGVFFMSWAIAGVPLGVYNIADDFNVALKIQPNILIFLSLVTWSQCHYYGEKKWSLSKVTIFSTIMAAGLGGIETGLVFALRVARDRGHDWASTLMAVVAAVLLAGGVLRHYVDMYRTRSDAGLSLRFAVLDASGDVASILSVVFQPSLSILGLVIYGSELVIWIGLIAIVIFFRATHSRRTRPSEGENGDSSSSSQSQ